MDPDNSVFRQPDKATLDEQATTGSDTGDHLLGGGGLPTRQGDKQAFDFAAVGQVLL
jgi:hypothetical protein